MAELSATQTYSPPDRDEEHAPRQEPQPQPAQATATSSRQPKQWIDTTIQPWCVCAFIGLSISMIITLIALLIVSRRRNGFVSVGAILADYGATWRVSILWTSLPAFVFTCLGGYWKSIADSFTDRQPFVGLARRGGGPGKETVLLDYRTTFSLIACLAFSGLVSLSAGLFIAAAGVFQQEVSVVFNSTFDQSAMRTAMDIRAVLDTVTARLIYGASNRPWTDGQYAFRPFYTAFQVAGEPPPTNATAVTARTVAHSAYLNCVVMAPAPDSDCTMTATLLPAETSAATVVMTATDRGCQSQQKFTVSEHQSVYFKTSAELDCGQNAGYSRLFFTYGHFSATGLPFLSNISVVSCAVGYKSTHGDLKVTVPSASHEEDTSASGGGGTPAIILFAPTEEPRDSRDDSFAFWTGFESKLFQTTVFSGNTALATSDFGAAVLYRAAQRQGGGATVTDNSTVLGGRVLAESISDVFTAVYLTSMATFGLVSQEGGPREQATATLEKHLTRLFVVPWVTGTVVGVLGLIVFVAICVLRHVRKHKTLLYEKPAGLLAYAGLLEDSKLTEVAKDIRDSARFDGKVVGTVLRHAESRKEQKRRADIVDDWWEMTPGVKPRVIMVVNPNADTPNRTRSGGHTYSAVPHSSR
ncbi:hypothetical protein NEMBOFW57_009438 [Staphylotrichum longicolle]|uniref:Uncharacterized protein n=1 Tax=Staphylotrichum longicolle TaxID=669026 RepID=A0AAD4HXR8_9PEZI|nr:hypothetical protein NEMBOFW57_009438 [Staphylotrichum longicolle]